MLLLILTLAMSQDTVRLPHQVLLDRSVQVPGQIDAADARAVAARERSRVAGRLDNPVLSVQAENLGMQERVTGKRGLEGTEGQVILSLPVALGGDRGARSEIAHASRDAAEALRDVVAADFRASVLYAMIEWERDRTLLAATRAERDALVELADAMTVRAREGRDAASDAALARLEAGAARSRDARQRAAASVANARLAAIVGLPAGTPVDLEPLACTALPTHEPPGRSADLVALDAEVAQAEARASLARAARIPDLVPQVGLRRSAGFSGLLVGLSLELPFFTGGEAAVTATSLEARASEAARSAVTRTRDGELAAHDRAIADLLMLAETHDASWREDLGAVVRAEERRLEIGEGSLFRLFDARRARLAALTEYVSWRETLTRYQVRLARLGGVPLTAALLCLPEDLP